MADSIVLVPHSKPFGRAKEHVQADHTTIGMVLLPIAVLLFCYLGGSTGPAVAAMVYVIVGHLISRIIALAIPGKSHVAKVVFATFAVCLLVASLSQLYATWYSGELQNTTDAIEVFYPEARIGLQNGAFVSLGTNSDGAVWIWQFLYEWFIRAGFGDGPWIGVTFNCFMISISSGLVFGTSELIHRMGGGTRNIAALCIYSPLLWLVASIHLRDAYTVLCSAVILFLTSTLTFRPGTLKFFAVVLGMVATVAFSSQLRVESAYMLGGIAMLGLVCVAFFSEWNNPAARALTLVATLALIVIFLRFFAAGRDLAGERTTELLADNLANAGSDSLGSQFIIRAALPIRLTLGIYYMFVHPIPLWAPISRTEEYMILMGLNGLGMAMILPLVADSILTHERTRQRRVLKIFVVGSAAMGIGGVVLSTMDPRHVMEFAPFLLAICVFSVPTIFRSRKKWLWRLWLCSIVCAHLGWLVLKI